MAKNKEMTNQERIESLKKKIIASNDKHQVKYMLDDILSVQRQAMIKPVEIEVLCEDVLRSADFESFNVKETAKGYLFQYASGGYTIFVGREYGTVASMLARVLNLKEKNDWDEFEQSEFTAICSIFQTPFFAALGLNNPAIGKTIDYDAFFGIATAIIKAQVDYQEKYLIDAKEQKETVADIENNIAMKNMGDALETIVNAPTLPEN